jgi:tol-pal system protein YbgF
VQQLEDSVARLQQSNDEHWALTKSALDQNTETLSKLAGSLTAIQQQLAAVQDSNKNEQLSAQVQAVHDSVDEVKARLAQLSKQLNDIAAAQQNLQSQPPAPAPGGQAGSAPAAGQTPDATQAAAAYVPPVKDLYQSAYRDYTGGHYPLAQQEFTQIVQTYPQEDLAGNAQFYLGEIDFHQGQYKDAAKAYDAVLQNYPGSNKSAAAQLRKGDALVQIGQRSEGIRELRAVIQRYPQSPEAAQARSTLNGMGVAPSTKPSPARNQ